MIIIGIIILAVAFTLGIIANKSTKFLIYVTLSLAGIGWATINVNSYPMIVEMSKGSNVGKYTGFYYTASMSAQIVTPIISGYLMENVNLRTLFPYSLFFTLLALVTMMFVKHGDAKKSSKHNGRKNLPTPSVRFSRAYLYNAKDEALWIRPITR